MLPYGKNLKEPSRSLRKDMTDDERVLWLRLRGKQILGIQFYRQKPVGPYIVDFYAPAVKLVVEADGGQHLEAEHAHRDLVRDAFLNEMGLLVLRFDNVQILTETDAVVETIFRTCSERQIPPVPPLPKGGIKADSPEPRLPKGDFESP